MDLNVSLGDTSRKMNEPGMTNSNTTSTGDTMVATMVPQGGSTLMQGGSTPRQTQQNTKKRKANRDSWPFMHAIMLLECFKEVWTKSNMGNLTMAQWTEVSNRVNTSCGITMNEQQCRTKVDNLKKRYKRERMKYAPTGHTSPWEFYGVMNKLFGNTTKLSAASPGGVTLPGNGHGDGNAGGNAGDDTEGSDEDDVVVLDNGGDFIFGLSEGGSSFGRGQGLLLEGPESAVLDGSPNGTSNVGGEGSFGFHSGSSPRSGPVKRPVKMSGKRKRESDVESYGDLMKEAENERSPKWAEFAKVEKKQRVKSISACRSMPGGRSGGIRALMDGVSYTADHLEADEFDDEDERTRDEFRSKSLHEAERKVELAMKALTEAQEEKDRLEGDLRVTKEVMDHRKTLGRALKFAFKKAFMMKMIHPENINVSLSKFPCYLSEITRDLLVEAVSGCTRKRAMQVSGLCSSDHLILLNGPRNSAIYQETLVKAIAHDQGLGLLVLESTDLAPQDYGDDSDSNEYNATSSKSSLRKGDRVVYRLSTRDERSRQERRRGRVVAVSKNVPGKIGIVFDKGLTTPEDASKLTNGIEELRRGNIIVEWHYASDFEKDQSVSGAFTGEWHAALSALCEIGRTAKPFIVFLPEVEQWFHRAVPSAWKSDFLDHVQKQLDKLHGNVAFISCFTSNEDDNLSERKGRFDPIHRLFSNVVDIFSPKDETEYWRWKLQLSQDAERTNCNSNNKMMQKVLLYHNISCINLASFQVCDFVLTESEAETLMGWAIAYECANPRNLHQKPQVSAENEIIQLRKSAVEASEAQTCTRIQDEHEEIVLQTVSAPETSPKFEDVGALEDVKKPLEDIIVLPFLRPELFAKGTPCKGVLLYGPPGSGKTLIAKAVAAEASASLIWLKCSSMDYKWFEDPKGMTRALFAISRRLAPAVIFLDEIDCIFGEQSNEAMNRLKLEFLSGWEKFLSRVGDQVVVIAATCRPFDIDEAFIQKFQRRLCIGLPDASSREKILHVLLAKEVVESGFNCKGVAGLTDGYSGCDLKNLTIAAACRQVREILEMEKAKNSSFGQECLPQELRPLTAQDLVGAMEEVVSTYNAPYLEQLRHWDEQYGMRRW